MTQTTFTDNVLVDGSQDIKQLRVQGHTTQTQQLQTWEDSAGNAVAQMTGDGRLIVGDDDATAQTPDSLVEAHRFDTSTSKPKRGIHSLGQITGTLSALVQWIVGELELTGASAISALHTTLRIRASNKSTVAASAGAELRAGDIEVINDALANAAAFPKATGLQVTLTNASGKTITDAVGLKVKMNNAGTITNPFSIYTEGAGPVHLEDYVEVKRPAAVPGTPATDFVRVYPKTDGKLYAKDWNGIESQLGGGSGSVSLAGNNVWTGDNDFRSGTMKSPVSAGGALAAVEGAWQWDSTNKCMKFYDGVRERTLGGWGYQPFAQPPSFTQGIAIASSNALAAVSGTMVIPIYLSAHMLLQSVIVANQDTSGVRTWGWDLYVDLNDSTNAITRCATSSGNETFTATVASMRTLAASSAPVYLPPGAYYLAIQNRHATNTFGVAVTLNQTFGFTQAKTKTTGGTNGSTLDIIAATWAIVNGVPAACMRGRAAGNSSQW